MKRRSVPKDPAVFALRLAGIFPAFRCVLCAVLVGALLAPASALAVQTVSSNGFEFYVMGAASPAYVPSSPGTVYSGSATSSVGYDLAFADGDTDLGLLIPATSAVALHERRTMPAGVPSAAGMESQAGYGSLEHKRALNFSLAIGESKTVILKSLGSYAGEGWTINPSANGAFAKYSVTGAWVGPEVAGSAETLYWQGDTPVAGDGSYESGVTTGWFLGLAAFTAKRVSSTVYQVGYYAGAKMLNSNASTSARSVVVTYSTAPSANGYISVNAPLNYTHMSASGFSNSHAGDWAESSLYLTSAESTATEVHDHVWRLLGDPDGILAAALAEKDSQDTYYQGVNDAWVADVYSGSLPASASVDATDTDSWWSSIASATVGVASGLTLDWLQEKARSWVAGFGDLFWFVPFFSREFDGW